MSAFVDCDLDQRIRDDRWTLHHGDGYFTVMYRGRPVAHMIMGSDGTNALVRYKNGNRLDLRRKNLDVQQLSKPKVLTKGKRSKRQPFVTVDLSSDPNIIVIFVEHALVGQRGGIAIVDVTDFGELLVLAGKKQRWYLKGNDHGVVTCQLGNGKDVCVARVIMRAGRGEMVEYKDGDPLNLRRSNLRLAPGPGKHNDHERLLSWHAEHLATPRLPNDSAKRVGDDQERTADQ